jgi:hypothetical protein
VNRAADDMMRDAPPEQSDFERRRRDTHAGRDDAHVFGLVRHLIDQVTTLFEKELALFKAETTQAIRDTRNGVGAIATGGAVVFAGFLFLLVAATLGLGQVVELWLSALIVGGVVVAIGAMMLASGKRKLDARAFRPDYTAAALRKDRNMIKDNIHESHQR